MKQFDIPNKYKSHLISAIKEKRRKEDKLKKDYTPTLLDFGSLQIYLARHFGFCYGVENAIEIAFKTIHQNPEKRIFLLSEMIHNPMVNKDLEDLGVQFLQDTYGNQLIPFETLDSNDIVLIPAFGTTLEIENILKSKNIQTEKYNTTCPFVEKVWNRSAQIAAKGYTIIIHGKPKHEETRATFSHASQHTPTLIINDMKEAKILAQYIQKKIPIESFYSTFSGRYSTGFDATKHLTRIGVVNQTTQLASETQAISDFLRESILEQYSNNEQDNFYFFADTRDTLCYATNDNQTAIKGMLDVEADLAIVVGGYNSSNTSHLVELCEEKLTTYFIDNANKIISSNNIEHCHWRTKEVSSTQHFLPKKSIVKILITSGASCPDSIVDEVIQRLITLFNIKPKAYEKMLQKFTT